MENGRLIIKVENLTKKYEDSVAVDNISFTVKEGEVFGLLGPNGAGKTTTLEIIETLRKPTAGKIEVDGLDVVHHSWEIKNRIGVQLQEAGFYPDLTLAELLKMFGGLYQVRVNPTAVLRRFSLEDKKKSFWQKLCFVFSKTIKKQIIIFFKKSRQILHPLNLS